MKINKEPFYNLNKDIVYNVSKANHVSINMDSFDKERFLYP